MSESKLLKLDLQHFAEKSYKASTGVEEFYYAKLDESDETTVSATPEQVEFAQTITVEMPQEPVRGYGDNKTAEIAVSAGNVSVTSAFHRLPNEDKAILFGLEKNEAGVLSYGSQDTPPYVAAVFAKTFEDGSKEWVGLVKGLFMRPTINAQTKGESTEFTPEEITAQFMDREVPEFEEDKTVLFAKDKKGETTQRDALFQLVFGQEYPGTTTTTTSSTTTTSTTSA